MTERTGAESAVLELIGFGTRYLFGIPGVHTLPIYDALADHPQLEPVVTRHEAGATHAADGYARVSGRPGVVCVVPGPGALNASTGVLCAHSDRIPMIILTVELDPSERQGAVHEGDLAAMYRPFTKAQLRITRREQLEDVLRESYRLATSAPAGPIQVLLPLRMLTETLIERSPVQVTTDDGHGDSAAIDQVRAFVQGCASPTLVLGTGVMGMQVDALELARRLGAPVFTDVALRGIIPEDDPLAAGLLTWQGANDILAASDGTLVLGSRLSEITTLNWSTRFPANFARVDADGSQLRSNYEPVLAVQADPREVLHELAGTVERRDDSPSPAAECLRAIKSRPLEPFPNSQSNCIHPLAAVRELRAGLPRNAIVSTDATATEFWLSEASFPVYSPSGFLLPEVQQTMGYSVAAAVGAALGAGRGESDRPVICITGDGSVQMMLGELATAASVGRQLTVVIFEDGYYNALRIYQDGLYGRQVGVKLGNPDFVALAMAYGAHGERIDDIVDLREAVERSLRYSALSVIAVTIDPGPLPDRYRRRLEQMTSENGLHLGVQNRDR